MTHDDLDNLQFQLLALQRELKAIGAPRSMQERATDAILAINYVRNRKK